MFAVWGVRRTVTGQESDLNRAQQENVFKLNTWQNCCDNQSKITNMEEDYDYIAETNDDTNVTISDNFENANVTETEFHEYHDYSYDDMPTKIHHLMYSDTLIVVISLIIMIIVGLVFRYVQ